jgi:hypothetical protein
VLDCTWSDSESKAALQRLTLLERKKQARAGSELHPNRKHRQLVFAALILKRVADSLQDCGTLSVADELPKDFN